MIHVLVANIQPDKVVRRYTDARFLRPVFSAICVQHISGLHSKFALRPHHVWNWKYGRHSTAAGYNGLSITTYGQP